jgi:hypothetical protein
MGMFVPKTLYRRNMALFKIFPLSGNDLLAQELLAWTRSGFKV